MKGQKWGTNGHNHLQKDLESSLGNVFSCEQEESVVEQIINSLEQGNEPLARSMINMHQVVLQNIVFYEPERGETLLHYAAREGHTNIVGQILDIDTEPLYVPDASGGYPIHHAVVNGHVEIIEVMMSISPLIIMQDDGSGENLWHEAMRFGQPELINILIPHTKDEELNIDIIFHVATAQNIYEESYYDLNYEDRDLGCLEFSHEFPFL